MKKIILIMFVASATLLSFSQTPYPITKYGEAGNTNGTFVPTIHTQGQLPLIGNANFTINTYNLPGGSPGALLISSQPATLSIYNIPIYINPLVHFGINSIASGQTGAPGRGISRINIPVPNSPSLAGSQYFCQGIFLNVSPPNNILFTEGLKLKIHFSSPLYHSCLFDISSYNKTITSAQAGRNLWKTLSIPGFTYLSTNLYTCGTKSHYIISAQHNQSGIIFNLVPGDIYLMGDNNNSGGKSEKPSHWVTIKPLLIATTEVTQDKWKTVMGTQPWIGTPTIQIGSNCPVAAVSWHNTNKFCSKMKFRLPSESEWEYACRAGTSTSYNYGSDQPAQLKDYCWYYDNTAAVSIFQTQQVGKKRPNAFGLFDMHGNVDEWCKDDWHYNFNGAPSNGTPWSIPTSKEKVVKGGSWFSQANQCRSPFRYPLKPASPLFVIGFRPCISVF